MINDKVLGKLAKLLERAIVDDTSEGAQALAAIRRWMKRNNKTAEWVIANVGKPYRPEVAVTNDWVEQMNYCGHSLQIMMLDDMELRFVMDMGRERMKWGKTWRPTWRQLKKLDGIYVRLKLVTGAYQHKQGD